jgi:hypothetical protein
MAKRGAWARLLSSPVKGVDEPLGSANAYRTSQDTYMDVRRLRIEATLFGLAPPYTVCDENVSYGNCARFERREQARVGR